MILMQAQLTKTLMRLHFPLNDEVWTMAPEKGVDSGQTPDRSVRDRISRRHDKKKPSYTPFAKKKR